MTTLARRNSSIHKIREYSLPKVNLDEEYDVIQVIQEGWKGRLLLVEHKSTRHEVVLKALHKDSTSKVEFFKEFHYNYYLSPHTNILNAYDVAFVADDSYVFAQEYAPFGDLTSNLTETGLGEANVKKIAPQIVSALEFMHSKDLVHMNINMDNILVFNIDFSEVKLCDFGSTKRSGSFLKKQTVWLPYAPPEVVATVKNEAFHVTTKQDVWQLGILLYILLTGALPWQKADITDPHYVEYINWKKRKTYKTPKRFTTFTARGLRMFKRLLEPKQDKRANVREVRKYLEDKWLTRPMKRQDSDVDNQSVCYSTFSVHSSQVEKDRVLRTLKEHGIETTVDRVAKRKRIHEWIERSCTNNLMFEEFYDFENEKIETNAMNNIGHENHAIIELNSNGTKPQQNKISYQSDLRHNSITSVSADSRKFDPSRERVNDFGSEVRRQDSRKGKIRPDTGRIISTVQLNPANTIIQTEIEKISNNFKEYCLHENLPLNVNTITPSTDSVRRRSIQDLRNSPASKSEFLWDDNQSNQSQDSNQNSSAGQANTFRYGRGLRSSMKSLSKSVVNNSFHKDEMGRNPLVERSQITNGQLKNVRLVNRSNSDRQKSQPQVWQKNYSVSKKFIDNNIQGSRTNNSVENKSIQRSKTTTFVNNITNSLSRKESETSLFGSDDSLTSVIPMAFGY